MGGNIEREDDGLKVTLRVKGVYGERDWRVDERIVRITSSEPAPRLRSVGTIPNFPAVPWTFTMKVMP